MKEKLLKIILIISFIPTLVAIILGSYLGIAFGADFFTILLIIVEYYLSGFKGMFPFYPFIPICLAYQLFYLTRHLTKKHKSKTTNVNKNIEQ